jgi:hypothetical protein
MAPLETSTTSRPAARSVAICCTQLAMAWRSRPASLVPGLPTLTTSRRAANALVHDCFRCRVWQSSLHLAEPRDRKGAASEAPHEIRPLAARLGRKQIRLVQHQPARLAIERLVVLAQLGDDGARFPDRIDAGIDRRDVHQVEEEPGAREMAQEAVTKPCAFGRA